MKKKILIVRNAAPTDFGGAERYPISLATLVEQEGTYQPIIVSRSPKLLERAHHSSLTTMRGWWWSWQNWNGKYVVFFPLYIAWQLILTGWYIALLLRTRATAIHLQSKDDFIAGTIAAKLLGRTSVWTDHMDLRYILQNISHPFKNPLGKLVFWSAKHADHIIVISDNEHRLVTGHFKNPHALDQQIVVIKNGVIDKLDTLKQPVRIKGETHFCMINRMVVNKGVGDAIEAFLLLDEPTAHLDLYGDGADIDTFKQAAKNHPNIHFYGHTDHPLRSMYNSDVFVAPSYQEGLSISLLESVMLGSAVITSNVDSNPEVIHDKVNGLLIEPKHPKQLSEAMKALLKNPNLRTQYGIAARKAYIQEFNLETIVLTKILPLYKATP